MTQGLKISYVDSDLKGKADVLSAFLNVPVMEPEDICSDDYALIFTPEGLLLKHEDVQLKGDFSSLMRRARKYREEQIVKAVRFRKMEGPLEIIDATAGLGEDSFILAAAGNRIKLFEKDKVIFSLLNDAYERGLSERSVLDIIKNMELHNGDSVEYLLASGVKCDVVFLDPMFPSRQKSSLVKKKLQLIQHFELPCGNEEELLDAAFKARPKKIVVKRPFKGPYLAGRKPSYSIYGSVIRYDCYITDTAFA